MASASTVPLPIPPVGFSAFLLAGVNFAEGMKLQSGKAMKSVADCLVSWMRLVIFYKVHREGNRIEWVKSKISRTVASAYHKGGVEYESIEVNIFFHRRLSHYEITLVLYFMVDQQPPVSVITFQKVIAYHCGYMPTCLVPIYLRGTTIRNAASSTTSSNER
ncbi:hypothetical protein SDJN02_19095, partial [Cucurbita argyrosperma subsp. argyrosperma]